MTAKIIGTFFGGVAMGSALTYAFVKKKYEKIAQDEIDSVKATFSKRNDAMEQFEKEHASYIKNIYDCGYSESSVNEPETDNAFERAEKPYIISPDEFGELDGYETISLIYHSDGILSDECGEMIDEYSDTVGDDFSKHFGEYEDDSVFIRNDILRCDYEVLADCQPYLITNETKEE